MISKNAIKYIQSLQQKKHRDEENLFVVEGPKMLNELLASNLPIRQIYATQANWLQSYTGSLKIETITPDELRHISTLETPNQVLALVEKKSANEKSAPFSVMLDGIRDPGNMGTILRICDWFGIYSVIASNDTVDVYNPKVVQASMGSILRTDVTYAALEEYLATDKRKVYAAMLDGRDIKGMDAIREGILLIGNESKGIRPHLLPFISEKITIRAQGRAESLNAGVALGIILSHIV